MCQEGGKFIEVLKNKNYFVKLENKNFVFVTNMQARLSICWNENTGGIEMIAFGLSQVSFFLTVF